MKKVTIHQPMYLPYMGFFNKIAQADVFVVLDDAKYTKTGFINRNKIKTNQGEHMITIPIEGSKSGRINDTQIFERYDWASNHLKTFQAYYSHAPYYKKYIYELERIYRQQKWKNIVDIDMEILRWLFKVLDISVEILFSSKMNINSTGGIRLVDICKKLDASRYVSGPYGKEYIEKNMFYKNNIKLIFQNFKHPTYPQRYNGFIPNLSIIDALFNCGEHTVKKMIKKR